jgi:hypothetical protein
MPRPVHYHIHADDMDRCSAFYSGVFGWKFNKWDGPMQYMLISTGEGMGIDGGMMPREQPGQSGCNTIDVPNLDEYIDKVKVAGGSLVMEKTQIPGVGWFCYAMDTDGNTFGMMQPENS